MARIKKSSWIKLLAALAPVLSIVAAQFGVPLDGIMELIIGGTGAVGVASLAKSDPM